jgi:hypothetical protein
MGQPRTVNRGLELARGEIIGFVSSDDPLLPGAITALVEALRRHPEVVVVYPDWDVIDGRGRWQYHVDTLDYSYVDMVRYHHTYPGPGALFRRSVVERVGGYDPTYRYAPDYDFWLRAGLLGPFLRLPQTLATCRLHAAAIRSTEPAEQVAKEHLRVVDKLYERDDLPPALHAVRTEAYRNAFHVAGLLCQSARPPDERFALDDHLARRWKHAAPASGPPASAAVAGPGLPRRNPAAIVYDLLSASLLGGRAKHAVPLAWRIATRRWLSRAGRPPA